MTYPVRHARVTCEFGVPGTHWAAKMHTGRDYAAQYVPVYATAAGKVIFAGLHGGWGADYGNHVIIESGNRQAIYAHLSRIGIRAGQQVWAGQRIGTTGATGNVTGPHLHYEERHAPFTYWDFEKPILDRHQFPWKLSITAVRKATASGGKVAHGRELKRALAKEVGRGWMNLRNDYLGRSFKRRYRKLQRSWYGSGDGMPGRASLTRLGGLHDFGTRA